MLGEVAPFLVPQFDALLVGLLIIAGALVALGMVSILHRFTRAVVGGIGGILGHLPGVGTVIASPVNAVAHWMDREFAAAERALDHAITFYFHGLADLVGWWGSEIRDIARSVYGLSLHTVGQSALDVVHQTIHQMLLNATAVRTLALNGWHVATEARFYATHATVGPIGAAIHTLLRPAEARVASIAHELGGFASTITTRVGRLEHAVATTIPQSIAGLRDLTGRLTDLYNGVNARVRTIEHALSTAGVAALVATALGTLGLGWLRCSNVGRFGRAACGLPVNLLEDVLGLLVDFLILENICTVIPWIEDAAELVGVPLVDGLAAVAGAGVCAGASPAPALHVPPLSLAPATGVHLYLSG